MFVFKVYAQGSGDLCCTLRELEETCCGGEPITPPITEPPMEGRLFWFPNLKCTLLRFVISILCQGKSVLI